MALPKIDTPTFMLELPSSGETIRYRPFTVKEEKILLMASQTKVSDKQTAEEVGKNKQAITTAIDQILNNCILSEIKISDLSTYDIEYIFVNLRAKSVNNIIELKIHDDEDDQEYDIEIDIDDIKVHKKERNNIIVLNDEVSILMKDPSYGVIQKINNKKVNEDDIILDTIIASIDEILIGEDEVVFLKDHTKKEQEEFLNSLSSKNMREIENYLNDLPKLSHEVSYTRDDGTVVTKTIEGMNAFFT